MTRKELILHDEYLIGMLENRIRHPVKVIEVRKELFDTITKWKNEIIEITQSEAAPLTYTPAQVIEMVRKAWEKGVEWGAQDYWMPEYDETPIRRLLTTLGLSVPGDKM